MTLSFEEFRRRMAEPTPEKSLDAAESDALEFLATGDPLDALEDETLDRHIAAVGGVESFLELCALADACDLDADAPFAGLNTSPSKPPLSVPDGPPPPVVVVSRSTTRDTTRRNWLRDGLLVASAVAATLLTVVNLRPGISAPEEGRGWTAASLAEVRKLESRELVYKELAGLLDSMKGDEFVSAESLETGLREAYLSCHQLRIQVDTLALGDEDRKWLKLRASEWGANLGRLLAQAEALRSSRSPEATTLARRVWDEARTQLDDMQRELTKRPTEPASSAA